MNESVTKRHVPSGLKSILEADVKLTKEVVEWVNKKFPIVDYRQHLKSLEVSCHGILWFMLTLGGMYTINLPELWVNLLLALIIDIVVVAVVKAFTRRRRPSYNVDDMIAVVSVDKFSFPSGHATRAVLLAVFFTTLYPLSCIFLPPLVIWSGAVCASRVILGRHHILDVVCGAVIGLLESFIAYKLWVSAEGANNLLSSMSGDDPWSGA